MKKSRNIVVCSDGTGNSGRGSDGTNVWRIRLAVQAYNDEHGDNAVAPLTKGGDLELRELTANDKDAADDRPEQIVIYHDGVGTEAFTPLRILGLALSYGVTKDLEYLYERLMLQHREDDRLFFFGFSRGAFTIRTLAYILYRCGLASAFEDDGKTRRSIEEVRRIAKEAVIAYKMRHLGYDVKFRSEYGKELRVPVQPKWGPGAAVAKSARDDPATTSGDVTKGRVPIEFVGVWDTVSAVGLPFHNMTQFFLKFWRGVTWCYPLRWMKLSLLNLQRPTNEFWTKWEDDLHPYINNAYHALSLDDERDTFYPLLWLEKQPCESESESSGDVITLAARRMKTFAPLAKCDTVRARRKPGLNVEQVWFAGMHSNVGGGYEKDHLAHVSLSWMMTHAARCGLRFDDEIVHHYRQMADPLGKMHDSRSGLAMFYRYNPREVEWFSRDAGIETKSTGSGGEDGNTTSSERPLIHDSVFKRIDESSQAYFPRHIPFAPNYEIVTTPTYRTPAEARLLPPESPRRQGFDETTPSNESFLWGDSGEFVEQHRVVPGDVPQTRRSGPRVASQSVLATLLLRVFSRLSIVVWLLPYVGNRVVLTVLKCFGVDTKVTEEVSVGAVDPRRFADDTIHLYVVVRRAAARWTLYVILIAAIVAMSGLLEQATVADQWIFRRLGNIYRAWFAAFDSPAAPVPVLQVLGILAVLSVALFVFARIGTRVLKTRDAHHRPFQPARTVGPWWPYLAPFVSGAFLFAVGFILRPLAHSLVNAMAPEPVARAVANLMESSVAFGTLCLAVYTVLWFNRHYAGRIESWAAWGWNSSRFGRTPPPPAFLFWPRSVVEATFSERQYGLGRYMGRFATRTWYPGLSMVLVSLAILYLIWIPAADLLTRASIVRANSSPVSSGDVAPQRPSSQEWRIAWKTDRLLDTGIDIVAEQTYIVDIEQSAASPVQDATTDADLTEGVKLQSVRNRWRKSAMQAASSFKRVSDAPYFQLHAAIGGPTGSAFRVTPGVPFAAPHSGQLFLFVNDVPGFYVNNQGIVIVKIRKPD